MYELDGQEYSLEEIQKAAEESNLTVEEYIQETGIVKKQAVAEDVADPKNKQKPFKYPNNKSKRKKLLSARSNPPDVARRIRNLQILVQRRLKVCKQLRT